MINKAIKLTVTVLLLLFATVAQAQDEHLKFMGIPLDGTIDEFQTKLIKKGLRVHPKSSSMPIGARVFEGKFTGQESDIIIYYNPKNKIVVAAYATINCNELENAITQYNLYETMLKEKYSNVAIMSNNTDITGKHKLSLIIKKNPTSDDTDIIGFISLQIEESKTNPYNYYLGFMYADKEAALKNMQDQSDDL